MGGKPHLGDTRKCNFCDEILSYEMVKIEVLRWTLNGKPHVKKINNEFTCENKIKRESTS